MKNPMQDIFEEAGINMPATDDLPLIEIDLDGIDNESRNAATELVENISKLYCNEDFIKQHPSFKKRIDNELESLRVLIKMRKTDELAHDFILKAIQGNSGNASLYKSLTEVQKTILSITTKMSEVIAGLNTILKGYQLELDFEKEEEQSEDVDEAPSKNPSLSRGGKEFIRMMEQKEQELFDDEDTEKEETE